MERSISVMVGKGSLRHNERAFKADNVDKERTSNNICFCKENLKTVYHDLFDEAVEKYNAKQTRSDRKVENYYEKICTSKQEKLFHELIIQVGNKDDMNARSENGQLAKEILTDYMQDFQERNENLKVFSAHLHMDEETPHLHIDFVPYITGSKRGMETRVSLKQALLEQGCKSNGKGQTEWKQFANKERVQLLDSMLKFGVDWEYKGNTSKHLSVLDFKKQEREKELAGLEKRLDDKKDILADIEESEKDTSKNIPKLDDPAWQLPPPTSFMSARTYHQKIAMPFFGKLSSEFKKLGKIATKLLTKNRQQSREIAALQAVLEGAIKGCEDATRLYKKLFGKAEKYDKIRKIIGPTKVDKMLLDHDKQQVNQTKTQIKTNNKGGFSL
ncbi:MAG: plasmid recombination protein [Bacillota bacterium]